VKHVNIKLSWTTSSNERRKLLGQVLSGAYIFKGKWRKNGTLDACIFKGKQRKLSGQVPSASGAFIFNRKWRQLLGQAG
jgi:hypothetical protein